MSHNSNLPKDTVRLAVIQMRLCANRQQNVDKAIALVKQAAQHGARVVLLPELFESLYFCQEEDDRFFALANPVHQHPFLPAFQDLAKSLGIVLPVSFFERDNQAYFNSVAVFDTTGEMLGVYRKTHIPDGPHYEEKYYFNPGNTGFRVWETTLGKIGVGICWDQWFPECARAMVLQGADVLLYPTAIGSEPPQAHALDTRRMWETAMLGHAVHNAVYVAAANRVGQEHDMTFYGGSFICDGTSQKLAAAEPAGDGAPETILYADLDFAAARTFRASMGFFRDRRPEHYKALLSMDGHYHQ